MAATKPAIPPPPSLVRWQKQAISLLLAMHLAALVIAPMAVAPQSILASDFWSVVRPYLEACYLNHGYHFFGPEPGPSHLVRYEIELPDGQQVAGEFPNKQEHWPRLLYHRHFMLSERLSAGDVNTPWIQEYARSYARHLHTLHGAKSVTLYLRTHELTPPGAIEEGFRLDDPRSYHEDKLLTYTGEAP
ncbi:MAG: hypothetical protein AB7I37_16600 [Pirellulales bacterium]